MSPLIILQMIGIEVVDDLGYAASIRGSCFYSTSRARRNGHWGRSRDAGHELVLNFSDDVTRLTRL